MASEDTLPTNTDQTLDFGKKKKKKKAKDDLLNDEAVPGTTEAAPTTSTTGEADKENKPAESSATADSTGDALDFGKKKKGTNKVLFDDEKNEVFEIEGKEALKENKLEEQKLVSDADSQCLWQGSERDYTYDELLTRVFNIMREKNPDMVTGEKRKFVMKPPQVARVGTKKTSFSNFAEICKLLRRQEKHLLNFLLAELGTSGSLDINKQLTIKGRFQQKQIENVLRRYIKEYVTCHTCRSPDTNMVKEERLFFLQCEVCGSRCSVASIKTGFQAQVGRRATARAKTT